jgi:RHS repeat-associated protein
MRSGGSRPLSPTAATAPFDPALSARNLPTTLVYDAIGQVAAQVDPLGRIQETGYDALGRATVSIANAVAGAPTTPITNVTSLTSYNPQLRTTTWTDPLSYTTQASTDELGRTTWTVDARGYSSRSLYDTTGLRASENLAGKISVVEVDGLGRPVRQIANYQDGVVDASDGAHRDLTTETIYDVGGRMLRQIDPMGRVTAYQYDLQDRLIAVTENVSGPSGCAESPCDIITRYRYDRVGNRTAVVNALNHARTFTYDAADRMLTQTDAVSGTSSWTYDRAGRVTQSTDARGANYAVSYLYDGMDQVYQISSPGLSTPITATYDAGGRRTALGDATGVTTFQSDPLDRLVAVNAPQTGLVQYGYNARGERTQLTYPDATSVGYYYDPDGRLIAITQGLTTLAHYTYTLAGELQTLARANGATTTYTTTVNGWLTDTHTTVGGATQSRFQYSYNRRGERTLASSIQSGLTTDTAYTYDGLGRLQDAANLRYSYDAAGNRTSVTEFDLGGTPSVLENRSYNAADRTTGWTYDAAGNLTSDGTRTYSYDALNRLTSVTRNGQTVDYAYNGDGVLVSRTEGTSTTRYAQDLARGLDQVLQTSQNGTTNATYVYGLERLATIAGSTRSWQVSDALGSVREQLDDTGTTLASTRFDAWGQVESGSAPQPFGFTGELHDPMTELVYLRARWYNPQSGTFTTKDPFEGYPTKPYSLHPYQYAYSNPVLHKDPTGKCVGPDGLPCPEGYPSFDQDLDNQDQETDNLCQTSSTNCPYFGHGLVTRLKDAIWEVAQHYAQFTPANFDANTLAVIMGAILLQENSYSEAINADPNDTKPYFPWRGYLPGSAREQEDFLQGYGLWGNPSTGIANLRLNVALEILNCQIPTGNGEDLRMNIPLLNKDKYSGLDAYGDVYDLLQQDFASLDFLAANIYRAILRAQRLGIEPSIFNIATWHKSGIQGEEIREGISTYDSTDGAGAIDYAWHVIHFLGASASLLGASPIQRELDYETGSSVNIYNSNEWEKIKTIPEVQYLAPIQQRGR